jgi:hypothetical protein
MQIYNATSITMVDSERISPLCATTLGVDLVWQFDIRIGPSDYIFKRLYGVLQ